MTSMCAWCEQCMALNGVRPGDWCSHHRATVAGEVFDIEPRFLCEHKHQAAPPAERRLRRRKRVKRGR